MQGLVVGPCVQVIGRCLHPDVVLRLTACMRLLILRISEGVPVESPAVRGFLVGGPAVAVPGIRAAAVRISVRALAGSAASVRPGITHLTVLHDLVVRLLDFLEFLLRLRSFGIRFADICVRMIFPGKRPVCFFQFIVRGIVFDAQNSVWIRHHGCSFAKCFSNLPHTPE